MYYGKGISRAGGLLDAAVDVGLIEKSGTWFSYKGDRIGQGKDNARAYIEAHPELMEELDTKLHTMLNVINTNLAAGKRKAVKPLKATEAAGDSADELDQDD